MTATDLLKLYNRMVPFVTPVKAAENPSGKVRGLLGIKPETIESADLLLGEIAKHGFVPGPYLASCFGKHHWAYLPPLGNLCRPAYVEYYRANSEEAAEWWANLRREFDSQTEVRLPVGQEIVRKRMIASGGHAFCFANRHFSGCYNRFSPSCQHCAYQLRCSL
jgi:hypothetical protein